MNAPDQTKHMQAYLCLKNDIINNRLRPNTPLVEKDICEMFGVSRTPVRQSLQQLERDGYVEYVPNKGMFVARLQLIDVLEIYRLREVLDPLAVEMCFLDALPAVTRGLRDLLDKQSVAFSEGDYQSYITADWEFHKVYVAACPNRRLQSYLERLIDDSFRFSNYSADCSSRAKFSLEHHSTIVTAFEQRNLDDAKESVKQHMVDIRNYYKSMI